MLNCVSRTLEGSPRYRSGSCAICTGPASPNNCRDSPHILLYPGDFSKQGGTKIIKTIAILSPQCSCR